MGHVVVQGDLCREWVKKTGTFGHQVRHVYPDILRIWEDRPGGSSAACLCPGHVVDKVDPCRLKRAGRTSALQMMVCMVVVVGGFYYPALQGLGEVRWGSPAPGLCMGHEVGQ